MCNTHSFGSHSSNHSPWRLLQVMHMSLIFVFSCHFSYQDG
uniref:Uncharacterized protein n=1 Tax=Rhizophora mucronata TaxID=61149 RepID=A0A2P2PWQ4_RHIMU